MFWTPLYYHRISIMRCYPCQEAWNKLSYVRTEQTKRRIGAITHNFAAISYWDRSFHWLSKSQTCLQIKNPCNSESYLQHGFKWQLSKRHTYQAKHTGYLSQIICVLPLSTSFLVSTGRNPVCAILDHSVRWGIWSGSGGFTSKTHSWSELRCLYKHRDR